MKTRKKYHQKINQQIPFKPDICPFCKGNWKEQNPSYLLCHDNYHTISFRYKDELFYSMQYKLFERILIRWSNKGCGTVEYLDLNIKETLNNKEELTKLHEKILKLRSFI